MDNIVKLDDELYENFQECIKRLNDTRQEEREKYTEQNIQSAYRIAERICENARRDANVRPPYEGDLRERIILVLNKVLDGKDTELYHFISKIDGIFTSTVDYPNAELHFSDMKYQLDGAKRDLDRSESDRKKDEEVYESISREISEKLMTFISIWSSYSPDYRQSATEEFSRSVKDVVESEIKVLMQKYNKSYYEEIPEYMKTTIDGLVKYFQTAYEFQSGTFQVEQPAQAEGESGLRGLFK